MIDIGEWDNHIRRIAAEALGALQFKGTIVCTAYNPKTHSIKGMIQPHNIESGWVPLSVIHAGPGYGILVGPRVGDPKKLDGQVFDLHFDGGDPDTLVATHRHFSTPEPPPEVQSGEVLVMQEGGSKVFFDKDKQVTLAHGPSGNTFVFAKDSSITVTQHKTGSMFQIDKDGNHLHDPKGKQHIFKGTAVFSGDVNVSGATTLASGTLGGLPIATT